MVPTFSSSSQASWTADSTNGRSAPHTQKATAACGRSSPLPLVLPPGILANHLLLRSYVLLIETGQAVAQRISGSLDPVVDVQLVENHAQPVAHRLLRQAQPIAYSIIG